MSDTMRTEESSSGDEISARLHNRIMHAANGNIDCVYAGGVSCEPMHRNDKKQFWSADVIECDPWMSDTESKEKAVKHLPKLYYSRAVGEVSEAVTNVATLYQYLASSTSTNEFTGSDSDSKIQKLIKSERHLLWIGVGANSNWCMKETECQMYENAKSLSTQWTMPASNYGYDPNAPLSFQSIVAFARTTHTEVDYRPMALKIDLYDELRDTRFVQPSGVDYAWATKKDIESHIVMLNRANMWHYEAIFISLGVFENVLSKTGQLRVSSSDSTQVWKLNDINVKVIGIRDNEDPKGLATWVIAHLTYPLVWRLDHYMLFMIGKYGVRSDIFVRTAGLVDIHDPTERIIFVIPDRNVSQVQLGKDIFKVVQIDHRGMFQTPVPVYQMDSTIEYMIRILLQSTVSLREIFSKYSAPYFSGAIDWREINSITVALTVRWHQKIESYLAINSKGFRSKLSVGAPLTVLQEMQLTADPKITDDSYEGYGGNSSVNGLDQRFVKREIARAYPAVRLGTWNNMAEIGVVSSFTRFETKNVDNHQQVELRMLSGGHDRIMRGQYLRRAFEAWKRSNGYMDEIAFPASGHEDNWSRLITGFEGDDATWFARISDVKWAWDMNLHAKTPGSTLTGIRTVSSWWRTVQNTLWRKFGITREDRPRTSEYILCDRDEKWTSNKYYQDGPGKDDPELDSTIMRLDLERLLQHDWELCYRTHPGCEEDNELVWVVDSSYGSMLVRQLGWIEDEIKSPKLDIWGWGLRVKNCRTGTLKTLVISKYTMNYIDRSNFIEGTILYSGPESEDSFESN